jgi:hypothetical protein
LNDPCSKLLAHPVAGVPSISVGRCPSFFVRQPDLTAFCAQLFCCPLKPVSRLSEHVCMRSPRLSCVVLSPLDLFFVVFPGLAASSSFPRFEAFRVLFFRDLLASVLGRFRSQRVLELDFLESYFVGSTVPLLIRCHRSEFSFSLSFAAPSLVGLPSFLVAMCVCRSRLLPC